jgi:acetyl-CoA C-acetyltransferase
VLASNQKRKIQVAERVSGKVSGQISGQASGGAVYVVSAVRTPIGKFGGALINFTAADLGVIAVRAALLRAFGEPLPAARIPGQDAPAAKSLLPWHVDEVIIGNARPAGVGPNLARQIAWRSGLGDDVPGFTVHMACASGLRSVILGWQQIRNGDSEIVVAGGAESMSKVPYLLESRWGFKLGNQPLVDAMYRDGFMCQIAKMVMGETAELLASQYGISREEQDEFALESQKRAAEASAACKFSAEIVPVEVKDKKGNVSLFSKDEHIRADTTKESLGKLPPVFSKEGTVTAGNSSGITDGAAVVVLASERKVRELNLKPLARLVDSSIAAVDPRMMGIGPVPAVRKLLEKTGRQLNDYSAIELNEAFAAQVLACVRDLHFPRERLNPNGGAIAIGHPIGCTGSRILTTLIYELQRKKAEGAKGAQRGLATLCVSGGLGVAVEVEAV